MVVASLSFSFTPNVGCVSSQHVWMVVVVFAPAVSRRYLRILHYCSYASSVVIGRAGLTFERIAANRIVYNSRNGWCTANWCGLRIVGQWWCACWKCFGRHVRSGVSGNDQQPHESAAECASVTIGQHSRLSHVYTAAVLSHPDCREQFVERIHLQLWSQYGVWTIDYRCWLVVIERSGLV